MWIGFVYLFVSSHPFALGAAVAWPVKVTDGSCALLGAMRSFDRAELAAWQPRRGLRAAF